MYRYCFLFVLISGLYNPVVAQQNFWSRPESVAYDAENGRYFISNVLTGNIVQITADGDTSFFSTYLPQMEGILLIGDTLFANSPLGIIGFDKNTAEIIVTYSPIGFGWLDDLCTDSSGNLWVTDNMNKKIFRVNRQTGVTEEIVNRLSWPTGIHYDVENNRLLFVERISNSPIQALDPDRGTVVTLLLTGHDLADGIADDNQGNYYISSTGSGMVLRYNNTFSDPALVVSSGHIGPSDIYYNKLDSTIVIPNIFGYSVDFIKDPYHYDTDHDGIVDGYDNCPYAENPGQSDSDADSFGDACDNCPDTPNPGQEDIDGDGIGDECEVMRTWLVFADGSGDAPTLTAAVDSATHGDTIVVANGIYAGPSHAGIDFGGRQNIIIRSQNGPRYTVIDCQGSAGDPRRAFTFDNGEDNSFVLDGFTIRGGYGPLDDGSSTAGAILFKNASPTVKNCVFTGNSAVVGGAISARDANPQFINCTFAGNNAQYGAGLWGSLYGNLVLENCIVAFNGPGAGVACYGSGSATLSCSDVYGNAGGDWTGCITGQAGINGNISIDPGFCSVSLGDCGLAAEESPCLPAHNSCGALIGALDAGCSCNCETHGDINIDGEINPVDVVFMVKFVYQSLDGRDQSALCPADNGDWNCDDAVNPVDVVYYVNYVYKSQGTGPCNACN